MRRNASSDLELHANPRARIHLRVGGTQVTAVESGVGPRFASLLKQTGLDTTAEGNTRAFCHVQIGVESRLGANKSRGGGVDETN